MSFSNFKADSHIFDLKYHPTKENLLYLATVSGHVDIVDLNRTTASGTVTNTSNGSGNFNSDPRLLVKKLRHTKAVRSLDFLGNQGEKWVSCSSDSSVLLTDSATDKRIHRYGSKAMFGTDSTKSSSANLNSALNIVKSFDQNLFIVGDDDGGIHMIDTRIPDRDSHMESPYGKTTAGPKRYNSSVLSFNEQEDCITDIQVDQISQCKNSNGNSNSDDKGWIYATSADGSLGVYDIRKRKLEALSDPQESELLSIYTGIRGGKKLVCGTATGDLRIFTRGDFGDIKDRLIGHKGSVEAMCGVGINSPNSTGIDGLSSTNESDFMITGCSDGKIRLVAVHHATYGNSVVGVLGEHLNRGESKSQSKNLKVDSESDSDDGDSEKIKEGNADDDSDSEESDLVDSDSDDSLNGSGPTITGEMPIEKLVQNPYTPWMICSTSHDCVIKFWDVKEQVKMAMNVGKSKKRLKTKGGKEGKSANKSKSSSKMKIHSGSKKGDSDFDSDDDSWEVDSDADSESASKKNVNDESKTTDITANESNRYSDSESESEKEDNHDEKIDIAEKLRNAKRKKKNTVNFNLGGGDGTIGGGSGGKRKKSTGGGVSMGFFNGL